MRGTLAVSSRADAAVGELQGIRGDGGTDPWRPLAKGGCKGGLRIASAEEQALILGRLGTRAGGAGGVGCAGRCRRLRPGGAWTLGMPGCQRRPLEDGGTADGDGQQIAASPQQTSPQQTGPRRRRYMNT